MRCLVLVLGLLCTGQISAENIVKKVGEIPHKPISELSGIVKSKTYDDVYWVHNDSGDEARVFAVTRTGGVVIPPYLSDDYHIGSEDDANAPLWPGMPIALAANIDWEDIAIDENHIYLADLGNNGNARRDLGIYVIKEPNPSATERTRTLLHFPVEYSDQDIFPAKEWHFDSECLFISEGKLYFITKHRVAGQITGWKRGANLYRMATQHPNAINQLTKIDSHDDIGLATGADISPDGQKLAVITYEAIWFFDKPEKGDQWLSGPSTKIPLDYKQTGQVEAITWVDNSTVLFTNEPGELFELKTND